MGLTSFTLNCTAVEEGKEESEAAEPTKTNAFDVLMKGARGKKRGLPPTRR